MFDSFFFVLELIYVYLFVLYIIILLYDVIIIIVFLYFRMFFEMEVMVLDIFFDN